MLFTHSASFSSPVPPPEALSPPSQSNPGTSPPSSRSSRLRRLLTRDAGPSSPSSSTASSSHLSSTGLRRSNSEYIASSVPRSAHRVSATTNNNAQPHHPAAPAVSSRANNRLTLISSAPGPAPHRHHHRTLSDEPHLSHSLDAAIIEDATEQQHDSDQPSDREQQPQDQEYPVAAAEAAATSAPESSTAQTATMSRPRASTTGDAVSSAAAQAASTAGQFLPSIRLSAYYDPRSTRPSLTFPTVSRTLPTGAETIRVGRYSERDAQPPAGIAVGGQQAPSAAAVGFKSKVVSRRHCEFWYEGGKWFIRDVKSSSGTFLNHIRLSPPSQESRAFPVNDGDIVQLGIDFKGGEEMIFRCVKMRIELNRGWQTKLNTFNMAAHKRLRTMAAPAADSSAASTSSQDCSICLNSIGPCQSLFVAPCSHTWHFKCVRSLLNSPQYPIFICPNCRAGADLEADVDDAAEEWERLEALRGDEAERSSVNGAPLSTPAAPANPPVNRNDAPLPPTPDEEEEEEDQGMDVDSGAGAAARPQVPSSSSDSSDSSSTDPDATRAPATSTGNLTHSSTEPLPVRSPAGADGDVSPRARDSNGPTTPRNEAGPWVFDGNGGEEADVTVTER